LVDIWNCKNIQSSKKIKVEEGIFTNLEFQQIAFQIFIGGGEMWFDEFQI